MTKRGLEAGYCLALSSSGCYDGGHVAGVGCGATTDWPSRGIEITMRMQVCESTCETSTDRFISALELPTCCRESAADPARLPASRGRECAKCCRRWPTGVT